MSDINVWYKWFGLNKNPFNTAPITKNQIEFFYKTSEIAKKIDPLLSELSTNVPTIKLIIGPRGLGKTSIFHYIGWKADEIPNLIPIYIDAAYESTKIENPSILIAQSILTNFLEELFNYLFLHNFEIWNKYKSSIDIYMNNIGFVMDHSGVLKNPSSTPLEAHFVNLRRITENMLRICQNNDIRFLLLIDNIDKGNLEPALIFFRESIAQSLFEDFNTIFKSTVYISGKNELRNEMLSSKYSAEYSYLQDVIILNKLTPIESYKIIEQRITTSCSTPTKIPFEPEVIHEIWIKNQGITRDIIIDVKNLLEKAFKFKVPFVTLALYKSRKFNAKENSDILSRLLEEDIPSRKGSEALMGLYTYLNCNANKFKIAINLLLNVYNKKQLSKENEIYLSELVERKFLIFEAKNKYFLIREDITHLFNKLIENGMELSEFMDWFISDHLEVIPIEIDKILPEDKLSELREQSKKHNWGKVIISKPDNYYSLTDAVLKNKVDKFFESALKSYLRLSSDDWDEIDNSIIFDEMWSIIFNVCKAITYLLASYLDDDIKYGIGDRNNDWNNIYYFIIQKGQNEFFYLENWHFIKKLYGLRKKVLVEKSYVPSREELMEWYSNIDKTIDELYNFWVNILSKVSQAEYKEMVEKVINKQSLCSDDGQKEESQIIETKFSIPRENGTEIIIQPVHISETKNEVVRVAVVQLCYELTKSFPPTIKNKDIIRSKVFSGIDIAQKHATNIVCLPELSLCEEWIKEIEDRYQDMIIIGGSFYKDSKNVCTVIIKSGIDIPLQSKLTPSAFEDSDIMGTRMISGDKIYKYETQFGKFVVLICRDFENFVHYFRGKDVDFIFCPAFNSANDRFHKEADNHITKTPSYILIANTGLYGGSSIFGQLNKDYFDTLVKGGCKDDGDLSNKLCEAKKEKDEVIIADFNLIHKGIQVPTPSDSSKEVKSIKNIKKILIT
ncbi:MAG: hypothetical protein FIB07_12335 [Candidatus Methanoperedens sp.]|nr:hypothetical protein [Candidatus Methanoperedens sp.]